MPERIGMPVFSVGDSAANFLPEKLYLDGCIWYNVRRKRMYQRGLLLWGHIPEVALCMLCSFTVDGNLAR